MFRWGDPKLTPPEVKKPASVGDFRLVSPPSLLSLSVRVPPLMSLVGHGPLSLVNCHVSPCARSPLVPPVAPAPSSSLPVAPMSFVISPCTSRCPAPSPVFPCVHFPLIPPVNPIPAASSQPVSPMSFVPSPLSPKGPPPSPDSWSTHPSSSRLVPNPQCGPDPPGLLNSVLPVFSVILVFSMVFLSHLFNAFSLEISKNPVCSPLR